eukprot:3389819-Heterocapsa_arctica.AAC.2
MRRGAPHPKRSSGKLLAPTSRAAAGSSHSAGAGCRRACRHASPATPPHPLPCRAAGPPGTPGWCGRRAAQPTCRQGAAGTPRWCG